MKVKREGEFSTKNKNQNTKGWKLNSQDWLSFV